VLTAALFEDLMQRAKDNIAAFAVQSNELARSLRVRADRRSYGYANTLASCAAPRTSAVRMGSTRRGTHGRADDGARRAADDAGVGAASRYATDYEEMEELGSGGLGPVMKGQHRLDGSMRSPHQTARLGAGKRAARGDEAVSDAGIILSYYSA
jgi:hypothetical protein